MRNRTGSISRLRHLKPVFQDDGVLTVGNSFLQRRRGGTGHDGGGGSPAIGADTNG